MTASLYDSIARIARHEASARPFAGVGRVVDVFPAAGAQGDHAVTVEMRDSALVLPRVPVAVGVMGFAAIPAIDELVVVLFTEGDYNAPVVLGRLYHAEHAPPEHSEDQIVLKLPSGSTEPELRLEVGTQTPSLSLTLPGEVRVEIVEGKVSIAVGEMRLSADAAGGGRAEVAAGGSSLVLKQDGEIKLHSASKLTLEGAEVEISGSQKVKITAAGVEIN